MHAAMQLTHLDQLEYTLPARLYLRPSPVENGPSYNTANTFTVNRKALRIRSCSLNQKQHGKLVFQSGKSVPQQAGAQTAHRTKGRPSTSATERARDVLPTPGGPMKHRMGARPAADPRSRSTARCSSTLWVVEKLMYVNTNPVHCSLANDELMTYVAYCCTTVFEATHSQVLVQGTNVCLSCMRCNTQPKDQPEDTGDQPTHAWNQ